MSARRSSRTQPNIPPQEDKEKKNNNDQDITEKVIIRDDDFTMRATVRQEPKKDKYGNLLDAEGNINKSRGRIGIMSNPNTNNKESKPLSVEDIKAQQAREREDDAKNIRLQNEQQKMLRYEMQGRLAEYEPAAEFTNHPLLQHPNKQLQKQNSEVTADASKGEQVVPEKK